MKELEKISKFILMICIIFLLFAAYIYYINSFCIISSSNICANGISKALYEYLVFRNLTQTTTLIGLGIITTISLLENIALHLLMQHNNGLE